MTRLVPWASDLIALLLFGPPAILLGIGAYMYAVNQIEQSTVFEDPHIGTNPPCQESDLNKCPIPVFAPGDLARINYTIKRNRACTIKVARVMEDVDGRNKGREQQVDYTEQTFGSESVVRPSGYAFEIPKYKPDDPNVRCQKYDVFSRVQYFCNELDKYIPRFMMNGDKRESKRVRIEVCRP